MASNKREPTGPVGGNGAALSEGLADEFAKGKTLGLIQMALKQAWPQPNEHAKQAIMRNVVRIGADETNEPEVILKAAGVVQQTSRINLEVVKTLLPRRLEHTVSGPDSGVIHRLMEHSEKMAGRARHGRVVDAVHIRRLMEDGGNGHTGNGDDADSD